MPAGYVGKDPVYLVDDVRCREGESVPARSGQEVGDAALTVKDVADLLGRSRASVRQALASKRWHPIPQPDGRIADAEYWVREHVERWLGYKAE